MEEQIQQVRNDIEATRSSISKHQQAHDELVRFFSTSASDLSTCLEPHIAARHVLQAVMLNQDCDERLLSFVAGRKVMLRVQSIILKSTVWLNAEYTLRLNILSKLQVLSQEDLVPETALLVAETQEELRRRLKQVEAEIVGMIEQMSGHRHQWEEMKKGDMLNRDWLVQTIASRIATNSQVGTASFNHGSNLADRYR